MGLSARQRVRSARLIKHAERYFYLLPVNLRMEIESFIERPERSFITSMANAFRLVGNSYGISNNLSPEYCEQYIFNEFLADKITKDDIIELTVLLDRIRGLMRAVYLKHYDEAEAGAIRLTVAIMNADEKAFREERRREQLFDQLLDDLAETIRRETGRYPRA